ncbi:unnamed protein product [Notodromas monacha]|uniref:Uncharacterized protein n=1 Tax=Notodromas monacha TaxID=399045 RepID=A0A7R9GE16_9CRUS|nr:unnamed protein product [Notodromas monacha]CAG0919134.1 unnamed protein product [Notodromas monacha]
MLLLGPTMSTDQPLWIVDASIEEEPVTTTTTPTPAAPSPTETNILRASHTLLDNMVTNGSRNAEKINPAASAKACDPCSSGTPWWIITIGVFIGILALAMLFCLVMFLRRKMRERQCARDVMQDESSSEDCCHERTQQTSCSCSGNKGKDHKKKCDDDTASDVSVSLKNCPAFFHGNKSPRGSFPKQGEPRTFGPPNTRRCMMSTKEFSRIVQPLQRDEVIFSRPEISLPPRGYLGGYPKFWP